MNKAGGLAVFLFLSPLAMAHNYYVDHAVGWHWYAEPFEAVVVKEQARPVSSDPVKTLHAIQRQVQQSLDLAIIEPTPQHVHAYMALQNALSDRAAQFAAVWQQVLVASPEVNFSLGHPTDAAALQVAQAKQLKAVDKAIKIFAENNGLFFFYKRGCPYCARFAPLLKKFARQYRISILPITLDGGILPEFASNTQPDKGQALRLGITRTPALVAVNPRTGKVWPVSTGLLSEAALRDRLFESVGMEENRQENST